MADQSDVEQALAALITSVAPDARVYRGWPRRVALDADVAAGVSHVSVVGDAAGQRVTTRYPTEWRVPAPRAPTLTATIAGGAVTFAGDAAAGQIVGVEVAGVGYVHRTVSGDTPASVTAALAAEIAGALATGPRLTVCVPVAAVRIVADQAGVRETRRQTQGFRAVCWVGTPAARDALAAGIDAALSAVAFIDLPDGTKGRLRAIGSLISDRARDAGLWRRDLMYSVDYATTQRAALPGLVFTGTTVRAGAMAARSAVS